MNVLLTGGTGYIASHAAFMLMLTGHQVVLTADSKNTFVHASHRLVKLVGVRDLIVVETPDAVLVADKKSSQDVKQLQNTQRDACTLHRKVHRPLGWYDSVDEGERFKLKHIQVKLGPVRVFSSTNTEQSTGLW